MHEASALLAKHNQNIVPPLQGHQTVYWELPMCALLYALPWCIPPDAALLTSQFAACSSFSRSWQKADTAIPVLHASSRQTCFNRSPGYSTAAPCVTALLFETLFSQSMIAGGLFPPFVQVRVGCFVLASCSLIQAPVTSLCHLVLYGWNTETLCDSALGVILSCKR